MSRFPAIGGVSEKPIADKDSAETFEESDVTLSLSNATVLENESVKMFDGGTWSDSWFVGGTPDSKNFTRTLSGDYSVTFSGFSGTNFLITLNWIEVEGDRVSQGEAVDLSQYADPVNITISVRSERYETVSWSLSYSTSNMGTVSAYVEWPQPTDIFRWDAATFNATTEGETVDVYIEESTDGGSTWTEIAGPISRGQPINAEPDSEVRLRADLQRDDSSNNPRLNSVYRRWVV